MSDTSIENAVVIKGRPKSAAVHSEFLGSSIRQLNYEGLWRLATMIWKTELLRPQGAKSPEHVFACLILAINLPEFVNPIIALQNMYVGAQPKLYGDLPIAIARRSGLFDDEVFKQWFEGEGDSLIAYCTVRRKPDGKAVTGSFSVAQAKRANLYNKMANRAANPWNTYEDAMLMRRATGRALGYVFADFLCGLASETFAEVETGMHAVDSRGGSEVAGGGRDKIDSAIEAALAVLPTNQTSLDEAGDSLENGHEPDSPIIPKPKDADQPPSKVPSGQPVKVERKK